MKLVVGLGNPGKKYVGTRHNVGYEAIERFARQEGLERFRGAFEGQYGQLNVAGVRVGLLAPETYMNLSGRAVQAACSFYDIEPDRILVVCDDFNLPLGMMRIRTRGSDGGQKGLRSIAQSLKTTEYPRLRVGIGPVPENADPANFVLGRFPRPQLEEVERVLGLACKAIRVWIESDVQECMNRFNSSA